MRILYALWTVFPLPLERMPQVGDAQPPIRVRWKAISQNRSSIPSPRRGRPRGGRGGDPGSAEALRPPDRQRAPADARRGARARAAQGRGRRGGQEPPDRVQPPARDVDHAALHPRRRAAARPDPGGQPRPDPRRREVRLHARLQALDVRDLVDPAVDLARARRAGPHDPPSRPRRRPGAPRHPRPAHARPEAQPRPVGRRDRARGGLHAREGRAAARARPGSRLARHADRRRRERDERPDRGRERDRARERRRPRSSARPSSRARCSGSIPASSAC